jgi:hypothetical protein
MRIDAQQHFRIYDSREYGWIDDSMASLRCDFLPAGLKPELERRVLRTISFPGSEVFLSESSSKQSG